ncbi:unnamed protein product [Arabidopsis arenosa]|uniref:Uncharacterized protein n=1 Tax=Arabidopsis arenosa TaxID=38785 RepID=A0A8S2A0P6_ARAAE|nr:unnamed protein product [Arabidopsis arenosa]
MVSQNKGLEMDQVILVCGKWIFENNKWSFIIDTNRGCRVLEANRETSYSQCIRMVMEDYGIENRGCDVVLSYKISKMLSQNLPDDTPPVIITNSRQFHSFLGQLKSDTIRLCVEVKKKVTIEAVGDDDDDDEETRFDYCDDSDGTDSDDENYSLYGIPPVVEEKQILPLKKKSSERSARARQATHDILGVLYKDFVGGIWPQSIANACC